MKSTKKYRENITGEYHDIVKITNLPVKCEVKIQDVMGRGVITLFSLAKENKQC
ncbi:MAG: hypothetical protein PHH31_00640 [Acidaminococcaceae bacterium]|nr:hypothetical protein [Acidaminococcaceae bacterium]MDD4722857.1 hypothetical protein [Acidaminococcaceae bacterium]